MPWNPLDNFKDIGASYEATLKSYIPKPATYSIVNGVYQPKVAGDVDRMRTVQWRLSYDWLIRFNRVKGPDLVTVLFKNYLPCPSVSINFADINSYSWQAGTRTYSVPAQVGIRTVTLTLFDNDEGEVQKWLEDWRDWMFPTPGTVRPLTECIMQLEVHHVRKPSVNTGTGEVTERDPKKRYYYVYPEGDSLLNLGSDSVPQTFDQIFRVVGNGSDENVSQQPNAQSAAAGELQSRVPTGT